MSKIELDVRNLEVSFSTPQGKFSAVNGINFQLYSGETLALVGESGCGKTVSALSILRLLPEPPAQIINGEIIYSGHNLLSLNSKKMKSYGRTALAHTILASWDQFEFWRVRH